MMRSLRSRLGAAMAVGGLLITLAAALAIGVQRWQEENASLPGNVELAAFQLSEIRTSENPVVSVPSGTDVFALVFDDQAAVTGKYGTPEPGMIDEIVADVWQDTTEQDVAVTVGYDDGGTRTVVSGVSCVDQAVCDSVAVGATETTLVAYAATRLPWLVIPAIIAAIIAFVATRWLVGRSLRPVDEMRSELETITATDLDRRVRTPDTGDELERLGVALNETIERLGAAVSANERFVADAAHELRSPITGVRAALEVEAAGAPGSMLDDSVRELDRASRIIDDLLVLARRQSGSLRHDDVDFDDVVVGELASAAARFPDVSFEQDIEPTRLHGDADALHRVVANLIENACFYGDGRIAVTLASDGGRCRLRVDDDGPGIPDESREAVFERFTRLDASRSRGTGGSGLGLAIVREIVVAHDGTVTAAVSDLSGARLEVTLPLSRE